MKKLLIVTLCLLSACTGTTPQDVPEEADTVVSIATHTVIPADTVLASGNEAVPHNTRKLRYLYFANGGLLGFFSDGSVSSCPRCELLVSNIETLKTKEAYTTYSITAGKLVLANNETMVPENIPGNMPEWAMIDYKMVIQVED